MKVVSILSGGLDSTILTYQLVKEFGAENVYALTFNYGQRHNIELTKAHLTCGKLGIPLREIDISFLGDVVAPVCSLSAGTEVEMPTIEDVLGDPQPPTYVPYRNMILNSIGFSFAESVGAERIYSGLQVHDEYGYWDTSHSFIDSMNIVSNLNRKNGITLWAPFADMSKAEEIKIGLELGVPFQDTWTCYRGEEGNGACGVCPSCSERIMNFAKAGLADPCPYEISIPWIELYQS